MAITVSGIGSGIDTASLVSQLVNAERQPAELRFNTKEAGLQSELSSFGTLSSALSQFQESVQKLNDITLFQARTASSSNEDIFSVSATSTAVSGSYELEVTQLAAAEKLRSGDFASETDTVGTGTLDISLGTDTFQVTIDTDNSSLAGVRDAINSASDNPGISAAIINVDDGVGGTISRLVLTSEETGSANTIDVVAVDDDAGDGFDLTQLNTANLTTIRAAQDAIIELDGQTATRSSNSLSDVISGITIDLNTAEIGTVETLTIALDRDSVKTNVVNFVAAYNNLADTVTSLGAYDAASGAAGGLQGDSTLRNVENQIRAALTTGIEGLAFGTLAEIGVTTESTGKLAIDTDKLDSVIDTDFNAVAQLFSSENGLATTLDDIIERYTSADGSLSAQTANIQERINGLDDDRARLDDRIASLEARLQAQFVALDGLVASLQSIGSFLTQQLANLPKPNSIGN